MARERIREPLRVDRPAELVAENEVAIDVGGSRKVALEQLRVPVAPERAVSGSSATVRSLRRDFGGPNVAPPGATSVQVFQQNSRTIPAGTAVIRDIDSVATKPEVSTGGTIVTVPLRQVAAIESNIPNVLLEQDNIESMVEVDLRLAIDGGLDQLVKTVVDALSNQAPSTDPLPTSVRKAMTTIQAAGYSPDTSLLTPAASETLDTLVSGISGATSDYVFGPGNPAGQLFGLQARVSKVIAAPVVVGSRAFGKLYLSPATLARFQVDAGATNQSNVRLELHAAFGTERQNAAVRIAAS